jgi:UDP-glucose 4-epimerase
MNILITGGAGYIGSHTSITLAKAGHQITIVDNLCNSNIEVIGQLKKILGRTVNFIYGDVRNTALIDKILKENQIDSVMHFAGLKSIAESLSNPLLYYSNNVLGSISLIEAMQLNQIKTFVFSSSATVYGSPAYLPYDEKHPTNPINPYGNSKLQVEIILKDWAISDSGVKASILRYFNPVGAHESGLIGENPSQYPNNLMPYITKVISGSITHLNIYGHDYETIDGTGVRDYIHVMDLAEGHLAALNHLKNNSGTHIYNLGTGHGTSVLELIKVFERTNQIEIPYKFSSRREGDLPSFFSDASKAIKDLGWKTKYDLAKSCLDTFRYLKYIEQLSA